jgi:hypothetical protein
MQPLQLGELNLTSKEHSIEQKNSGIESRSRVKPHRGGKRQDVKLVQKLGLKPETEKLLV